MCMLRCKTCSVEATSVMAANVWRGTANYVVKRTCGELFRMNRALSVAGRLPRR